MEGVDEDGGGDDLASVQGMAAREGFGGVVERGGEVYRVGASDGLAQAQGCVFIDVVRENGGGRGTGGRDVTPDGFVCPAPNAGIQLQSSADDEGAFFRRETSCGHRCCNFANRVANDCVWNHSLRPQDGSKSDLHHVCQHLYLLRLGFIKVSTAKRINGRETGFLCAIESSGVTAWTKTGLAISSLPMFLYCAPWPEKT